MSAANGSPALQYPLPETPFETVLHGPIPAFSTDADILNEILNTAESRRNGLYQEIKSVSSRLQQLREHHDNFNKFIERHRRLQPAVQRLPASVLEIIFMQCMMVLAEEEDSEYVPDEDSGSEETDVSDEGSDEMSDEDPVVGSSMQEGNLEAIQVENDAEINAHSDNTGSENSNPDDDSEWETTEASESGDMEPPATSQPPWVFTHVCRYWREVALSCPRIWATFSVSVDPGGLALRGMRSASLPLLRRQLRNTANWPLKFEFYAHEDDPISQLFLNTLAARAGQWESAQFYLPLSLLETINHVPEFQRLKTLDITTIGSRMHSETIDIFPSAPQLKEFRFSPSFPTATLLKGLPLQLPPNQITRFSLRATQRNHLLSLNLIKTRVEYIELITFTEEYDEPDEYDEDEELQQTVESLGLSVIELPCLQVMTINALGDAPVTLLNFLNAPSLHTLSIDSSTSGLIVSDLIRRSSASLTSLTINSDLYLRYTFTSLLEATYNLVELDLSIHAYNIDSLECLLDPVLLVRLKILTLRVTWSCSSANLHTILAVAKARSRPPATCHIMFDREVPDSFSEQLENLSRMEGYSLTWEYVPVPC